ncbi:MAG: hypothetical protein ACPMAQ_10805 [Phycisphaerae bacterium]
MSRTRTLAFVQEEIDIEALRRLRPDALLGTLVCFDSALHHHLLEEGIDHCVASDFVSEREREELGALFDRLWDTWNGFLRPPIDYRGIDPFRLAPTRHLYCLRRVAYSVLVIRRALDQLRPSHMTGFLEHDVHGLEQPIGRNRRMPLVQGLARFEAATRDIPYTPIDRRDIPGYVPWTDVKAQPPPRPPRPRRPFRRAAAKPLVIAAGNGRELLQQRPVVEELRRRGLVQVLHLALVMDPETRAELAALGHGFHELADFDPAPPAASAASILREAASRRDAARRNVDPELRVYFDNPFIESHFDFLLGPYLQRMLTQIERCTTWLAQWQPDLVLVNWDLPLAGVAQAHGTPVLAMLHALMSPIDPTYHHWAHSHLAVLSCDQARRAVAAGTPAGNVRATGHPDSDTLFRHAAEAEPRRDEIRATLCRNLNIAPARRLILLLPTYIECISSNSPWFPNVDMRRAVESWKQIAEMADRHPDWHLIVKGHPRTDHLHVYRSILGRAAHRNVSVPERMTLAEIGPAVDAAVICNATTSAQLEICFWKPPVVLLDDARCWLNPYARDAFAGWSRVTSVAQLERWLETILADPDYRRRQQEAALTACDAFTGPRDGRAAQRVADFVHDIVGAGLPAMALPAEGAT